jgi:hypothetical protein
MNRFIKLNIILFGVIFGVSSCQKVTMSEPISPDNYPEATLTSDASGSELTEGDVVTYTLALDKPLEHNITFEVTMDSTTTAGHSDYSIPDEIVIPAYYKEVTFTLTATEDAMPELDEVIAFNIAVNYLGTRYTLKPETSSFNEKFTIKNKLNGALTVGMTWTDDHDDYDVYMIDEIGAGDPNGWGYDWSGFQAATGAYPEVMVFNPVAGLPWDLVDGVYYVDVDPYDVVNSTSKLEFAIEHPDGKLEFIDVDFDVDKYNNNEYPMVWAASVLKMTASGSTYTFEKNIK